jgi:hypothetical protein
VRSAVENWLLFGASAKWRKATVSFVMSVCPHRTTCLPLNGLPLNLSIFQNVEQIQVLLKSDNNNGYFIRRLINVLVISRSILIRIKNDLDEVMEKIKTSI